MNSPDVMNKPSSNALPPVEDNTLLTTPTEQVPIDLTAIKTPVMEASGLGDGNTNQFYSERQALLWASSHDPRGTEISQALSTARESIDHTTSMLSQLELQRASLGTLSESVQAIEASFAEAVRQQDEQGVAISTAGSDYLNNVREAVTTNPQQGVALATAEAVAAAAPLTVKQVIAFHEYQNGVVGQRMADRNLFSLGTDNYAADMFALLTVPGRTLAGQMDVGNSPWFGNYYNRLNLWRDMPLGDRAEKFDDLESEIWDASGNNMLVYASLMLPFINPEDEVWAKIDTGLDLTAIGATVFAVARGVRAVKTLSRYQKVRSTANMAGNEKLTGKLVAAEIRRGNSEAVVEGHPIELPHGGAGNEEFVANASYPTQNTLVDELIANGIVKDGAGDVPTSDIPKLNDSEVAAAIERRKALVVSQGNIVSQTADDVGVEFTVRRPITELKPVKDARTERVRIGKDLKALRKELEVALVDGNSARTKELMGLIEETKARRAAFSKSISAGRKAEEGGLTGVKIKVPGSTTEEAKIHFNWTVGDVGILDFAEGDIGFLAHWFGSQELRLDKVMNGQTALGTAIAAQQRGLLGHILRKEKQIRSTLKGNNPLTSFARKLMGNNEVQRVDAVLMKGDELQTTFSDSHLAMHGVETSLGMIRLNAREIQAYKDTRDLYNSLWRMLNDMRRKDLRFSGQSAFRVNHVSKDGSITKINVFGRADEIGASAPLEKDLFKNDVRARHVIDARTGDVVDTTMLIDLEKDLAAGRRAFVKLKDNFIQGDGKHYTYILVDVEKSNGIRRAKQAREIPEQVLDYRDGYVPKLISDPINFVVHEEGSLIRNGVEVRDTRVLRGFKNRAEAEAFVNQQQAKLLDKVGGPVQNGPKENWTIESLDETYRRSNPDKMEFINQNMFHGAFGGARTDGTFKIGLDGRAATRQSAYESLRRYADFVARNAPMHEYKSAMIKRFLNSVKHPAGNQAELDVPWDWTSKITMSHADPRYRGAAAMQDWMRATFAVPSTEERVFQKFTRDLAYTLDRAIYKDRLGTKRWGAKVPEYLQSKLLSSKWAKDPFQAAKGFTFDMMLGMFNPAQLFVQSAGMAVPLSLHPIESALATPKFLALRSLWQMSNMDDAARVAKAMGQSENEFKVLWSAFRRSGIPDSVIENADFGHYITTQSGYYSVDMWSKIKESGRIFYSAGELNNRSFAWTLAYERMMKEHGWSRLKHLTDQQLLTINEEALRLGMNMTQANRAAWQSGPLALPTQFMQVTAKYYENMISGMLGVEKGGKWSRGEAASSFFLSTLAFGAAGWSADELWANCETWMTDSSGPFALDPANPEHQKVLTAARGGFMEYLAGEALGFTPDISDRIALGSGVNMIWDNIVLPVSEVLFNGDARGLPKAMFGASATVGTRTHKAVAKLWEFFTLDAVEGNISPATMVQAAAEVAGVSSMGSNLLKAHAWASANDVTLPSTGEKLGMVPAGESIDPAVIAIKAMGFDPLDLEKYYLLDRKSRDYANLKREIAQNVAKEYRKLYFDGNLLTDDNARKASQARLTQWVRRLDAGDRDDVLKQVMDILDEDPATEKLFKKMFDRLLNQDPNEGDAAHDTATDMDILRSLSTATQNQGTK